MPQLPLSPSLPPAGWKKAPGRVPDDQIYLISMGRTTLRPWRGHHAGLIRRASISASPVAPASDPSTSATRVLGSAGSPSESPRTASAEIVPAPRAAPTPGPVLLIAHTGPLRATCSTLSDGLVVTRTVQRELIQVLLRSSRRPRWRCQGHHGSGKDGTGNMVAASAPRQIAQSLGPPVLCSLRNRIA